MAFDQVRFEDQGLFLGPGDDGLEGNNFFNQQRCFRIRGCRTVKIGRQPFFQGNGLADVEDLLVYFWMVVALVNLVGPIAGWPVLLWGHPF